MKKTLPYILLTLCLSPISQTIYALNLGDKGVNHPSLRQNRSLPQHSFGRTNSFQGVARTFNDSHFNSNTPVHFNKTSFNSPSFQNQSMTLSRANTAIYNGGNNSFVHETPSFNHDSRTVINTPNHTVVTGHPSTTVYNHNNTTVVHHNQINQTKIVNTNNHAVIVHQGPGPVVNPHGVTVINHHTQPVVVNRYNNVNINTYGYHGAYYGPYWPGYHPAYIPVYHNYYYGAPYYGWGYYNNNVNDVLAVALTLSLIGNVAQYAAYHSAPATSTVVYQPYPVYPPYSSSYTTSTMAYNQPIPYAPNTYSGSSSTSTSSHSTTASSAKTVSPNTTASSTTAPINITVNTTVNGTTPSTTTSTTETATPAPASSAETNTSAANTDLDVANQAVPVDVSST